MMQGPVLNWGSPCGKHADDILGLFKNILLPQRDYIERVITLEEKLRGVLARTNRMLDPDERILAYQKLIERVNFFARWVVLSLDAESTAAFTRFHSQGIPAPHLTQMKQGKRCCTPEYDLRLSAFFGITPGLWMNLQLDYEFIRADCEKG